MSYFIETDDEGMAELDSTYSRMTPAERKQDWLTRDLLKLKPGEAKLLGKQRLFVGRRSEDGQLLQWAELRRPVSEATAVKRLAEAFATRAAPAPAAEPPKMKTLKDLTDALLAAGCVKPKKERDYPRAAGYREPLVSAWLYTGGRGKAKEREADAEAVFTKLREAGFELSHTSHEYSTGEPTRVWVQAKVALAEGY